MATPLVIPRNLAEITRDVPQMGDWLAALPATVELVRERWSLRLGPPFEPGGRTAWVAPVRCADGTDAVVKVGYRHPEAEHEAAGLRAWGGASTVRVLDDVATDDSLVLLLERCVPGTPLAQRPEPEQDDALAEVLPRLWIEPSETHPFPTLASMCSWWADAAEARFAASGSPLADDVVAEGLGLLRSLPRSSTRPVLLATDLHADNVLAADRRPWLAIDPKPHVGDPTYDAVQHLLNCTRLRDDPGALVRRVAAALALDAERLASWTFARCVQESDRWDGLAAAAVALRPT